MKQIIVVILLLAGCSANTIAQTGAIAGKVMDENRTGIIGALVEVSQKEVVKGGAVTDERGDFKITGLNAGTYKLRVRYVGYKEVVVENIGVKAGKTTKTDMKMVPSAKELQEVITMEYKVPLIRHDEPGASTTLANKQIEKYPIRNTSDAPSLAGATYQSKSVNQVSISGSRTSGTLYAVDGVQVNAKRRRDKMKHEERNPVYYNPSNEDYAKVRENDFMNVKANPLSTLSVDVDRASYSNVRRFINDGQQPPADAVRVEEMVNYFSYDYPEPEGEDPIAISTELTDCPWNEDHLLLRVGMQAQKIAKKNLPPSNLVFLIDVSGSMATENKLPLVKSSLTMLTNKLRAKDRVSIVVYAGSAGVVLPSTPGNQKEVIIGALDRLQSGGSTAGGQGIQLAYKIASDEFIEGGNNRVILATDGDFNVGVSANNQLEDMIVKERKKGIFLTCLGYGMGNYKDSKMEVLADKGNGNYAYIDDIKEAEKTLIHEFGGTLFTVAKDVKAQIEFNPAKVQNYRLVGYENRLLNEEDFKDDKKDAGEMGSGHQVTILYELIPAGRKSKYNRKTSDLKYQERFTPYTTNIEELATIKFRYKKPDGDKSREMVHVISDRKIDLSHCSADTRFASSVALFGMLLRKSKFLEDGDMELVAQLASGSQGEDEEGYRADFNKLLRKADKRLSMNR